MGRMGSRAVSVVVPQSSTQATVQGGAAWLLSHYSSGLYVKYAAKHTTETFGKKVFNYTGIQSLGSVAEWCIGPFALDAALTAVPNIRKIGFAVGFLITGIVYVTLSSCYSNKSQESKS